jgi:hypothetical protein
MTLVEILHEEVRSIFLFPAARAIPRRRAVYNTDSSISIFNLWLKRAHLRIV